MSNLTLQQISDFNDPLAFARQRVDAMGVSRTAGAMRPTSSQTVLATANLSDSFGLVSGLASRLGILRGNLMTMWQLANQGGAAASQVKRDDIFGKLRSLSGGLDDIVEATVWKGEQTLTGRTLNLSLTRNGGSGRRIEIGNYLTANEEGLNLTRQPESAKSNTFYDFYSVMRNSTSGIVGLDVTGSRASAVATNRAELETGVYQVEISYAGPDSSVVLKSLDGVVQSKVDKVDLSGTGNTLVDTGVGVTVEIDKLQLLRNIDKYDYETNGPGKFHAKLSYERVYRHDLYQEGFQPVSETKLEVLYNRTLKDSAGTGSLSMEAISLAGVRPNALGLESGMHSIRVNYNGAKSYVEVKDTRGRIQYLNFNVDLSGDKPVTIDTGMGLQFRIRNDGYADAKGQMLSQIDYTKAETDNTKFDFAAYSNSIRKAIESIDKDIESLWAVEDEILLLNSYQNNSAYMQSGSTFAGAGAISLLTQATSGQMADMFSAAYANTLLGSIGGDILSNTSSAMAAQINRLSSRSGSALA